MEVAVSVPVYRDNGTLSRLLDSLASQSYKNFAINIIFKPSSDKNCDRRVFETIDAHDNLDIKIIKQSAGRFEEAMNIAYGKIDADIIINTDGDAYASKSWVSDHVGLHNKYYSVGIATGLVIETRPEENYVVDKIGAFLDSQKWRMNRHTFIDRPIDKQFYNYGMYIGVSGMLVDTGKRFNMIKTFKQHGVNMSWKRDALEGFKLPCYTKQGGRNEAAAALEAIKRGFKAIWFKRGINYHPLHGSDSRSTSISSLPLELTVESVLFSYYVSKFYDVNIRVLHWRTLIDNLIARIITLNKNYGYSLGYDITKEAINSEWPPNKVRECEIESL